MENQNQKWVTFSFVGFAALIGYVLFALMTNVAAAYDLEARFQDIDLLIRGISVGIAGVLFFVLYKNEKTSTYMNEVVVELFKVTWPTSKDTQRATVVVMIMVVISGLVLGGLDTLWTWLLRFVL